jgi:hypothetical protein
MRAHLDHNRITSRNTEKERPKIGIKCRPGSGSLLDHSERTRRIKVDSKPTILGICIQAI